jgi:hypothetical protein
LKVLAGAVKDRDEWLIVLLGDSQEGGLHIVVNDFYVPPTQHRTGSHCKPYRNDFPNPDEEFPPEVTSSMVGCLHSHNSMGARFSGGDLAKDGICSTFPMNIVIGSSIKEADKESYFLGFEYQAKLHFELPCGGIGVCGANIIPKGVEDWPIPWEVERAEGDDIEIVYENIGDCDEYLESEDSTPYSYRRLAKCGIIEKGFNLHKSVFGSNGKTILSQLPKPYTPTPMNNIRGGGGGGIAYLGDYSYHKDQDSILIDEWAKYAKDYEEYLK